MACPLEPMGANIIVTMDKESTSEKKSDSGILIVSVSLIISSYLTVNRASIWSLNMRCVGMQAASVKTDGPKTGKVEAVGHGWVTESGVKVPIDDVKVGDKIMFR